MNAAVARILLRYASSALVSVGFMSPDIGGMISVDPDVLGLVEIAIGTGLGLLSEGWYLLAKRLGWKT